MGDGLVLGTLFSHLSAPEQIPVLLDAFEDIRRPRVRSLVQEACDLAFYLSHPAGEQRNTTFRDVHRRMNGLEGVDDEKLRDVWERFIRIAGYDEYEVACDWWTKWGAALQTTGEQSLKGIEIPVVQVTVDMI